MSFNAFTCVLPERYVLRPVNRPSLPTADRRRELEALPRAAQPDRSRVLPARLPARIASHHRPLAAFHMLTSMREGR